MTQKPPRALEDYGLTVDFLDPALHRLLGHPHRPPWRATPRNWPTLPPFGFALDPGYGQTKEEAIANLRHQFAQFVATHDELPEPCTEPAAPHQPLAPPGDPHVRGGSPSPRAHVAGP